MMQSKRKYFDLELYNYDWTININGWWKTGKLIKVVWIESGAEWKVIIEAEDFIACIKKMF